MGLILCLTVPGVLDVVGAVLAGGLGRRAGGDKAMLPIGGRPMVSYGLAALREALDSEPVVVAKRGTALPEGVAVWLEPDEPRHPLTGIVHALERAGGRDVMVLAVDLPLVSAAVLGGLVEAAAALARTVAVVAVEPGGRVQPLCGVYPASSLGSLRAASAAGARMTSITEEMGAVVVEVPSEALFNVNTLADAVEAERLLASRS
jgi:molybdopterin-guanine dinucleotide biosynthesis protein A